MKSIKALLALLLAGAMIFSFSACTYIVTIEESTPAQTEPQETEPVEQADPSYNSFLQSMVGTENKFSVAYFGYNSGEEGLTGTQWLQHAAPNLCRDLPFLTEIPNERIVGTGYGEIYCIVPADENAVIEVVQGELVGDIEIAYTKVLQTFDSGEPFILSCNEGYVYPDTQVTITGSDGVSVIWYPQQTAENRTSWENGTCYEDMLKDFSDYNELMRLEYDYFQSSFYTQPTREQLIDTSWYCKEWFNDDEEREFSIWFQDGTATVTWTMYGETHTYNDASWELTYEENVAIITMDFREFAGEQSFAVLVEVGDYMLYTCADFVNGDDDLCDTGVQSRMLERSYG